MEGQNYKGEIERRNYLFEGIVTELFYQVQNLFAYNLINNYPSNLR